MGFSTITAAQRLRAIGITPGLARDLVNLVQKWIRSSGEEWTVDRIKELKLNLLRAYAGLSPLKAHSWIRYGTSGPRGPFGAIFRLARSDMRRAWNAVMIYTGLVFHDPSLKVTTRQWQKAVAAIQRPELSVSSLTEGLAIVHQTPFFVPVEITETTGSPLVDYVSRPTRRAPVDRRTIPEERAMLTSLNVLDEVPYWTQENWDILSGTLEGLENLVVPFLELRLEEEERTGGNFGDEVPAMGLIALIQEAGYKLRFAANPYRVFQAALQPVGRALFRALRRVPNDFTFDQNAGVAFIQRQLADGKPAVSMDLSNATDNAPLNFQLELLSRLGVRTRWLQFFQSTCRGRWFAQPRVKGQWQTLRWTVGSPLGLYPTFAAFALWHHSLVQWCCQELGVQPVEGRYPYAIVGDDVVILDEHVAWLYAKLLARFGIPISHHKSLWCDSVAEFVGRVITSDDVVQGFKWKGRCSDESFVDFARMIGPGAIALMRPRQRRVISYIADLPEPYGLGWNPLGIPLSERLTPQVEEAWARDERLRQFERRAERVHRWLYSSQPKGPSLPMFNIELGRLASDQEAATVVSHILPGWEAWEEAIWPNLSEVVLQRETPTEVADMLRLMLQRSSHVETRKESPTLVVLERKIRRAVARSR